MTHRKFYFYPKVRIKIELLDEHQISTDDNC